MDGNHGCGTNAKGYTGWALGPDRAVDGNTNTWTHVSPSVSQWDADPFGTATFTNPGPWFGVDLGTPGNQLSHVLIIKTASWIDFGGRWKENYPVSIYVGDSQDWTMNERCAVNVTDFGLGPQATLVSLNGASSLEPIRRPQVHSGFFTDHPDLPASVIRFSCQATGLGRWFHIVMQGTDFLTMGEVEVYGNRTVSPPHNRWTAGCSRGTYLYGGSCVECPKGWTT